MNIEAGLALFVCFISIGAMAVGTVVFVFLGSWLDRRRRQAHWVTPQPRD